MKITGKVKKKNTLKQELKKVQKKLSGDLEILVGIPEDATPYPDGTSVALVAAVHEFGTATVPERSFIRSSIADNQKEYIAMAKRGVKKVLANKLTLNIVAELIGTKAQGDIQAKIVDVSSPPLKAATIAAKGSSNPLVDTGHLRQSVRYEVLKKGDR